MLSVVFVVAGLCTSAVGAQQWWAQDRGYGTAQRDLARDLGTTRWDDLPSGSLGGAPFTDIDDQRSTGNAFARLRVPRAGVDAVVMVGTGAGALRRGPGWMIGSAVPGDAGTTVFAGHRTTWGAPFARLDRLRVGDRVQVTIPDGTVLEYRVRTTTTVTPDAVEVTQVGMSGSWLVLVTCTPRWSSRYRLVVTAELVEAGRR
jgi:sortase A